MVTFGSADSRLQLKITVPLSWEDRQIRDALILPFMKAYEKKFPASEAQGPFDVLKSGPCILSAEATTRTLRARAAHGHAVEVEIVAHKDTAAALAKLPTLEMLREGERLVSMLGDSNSSLTEMHQLVDTVAAADCDLAYRGMVLASDEHGSTALHLALTRADRALCEKLMAYPVAVHARGAQGNTALMYAAQVGAR